MYLVKLSYKIDSLSLKMQWKKMGKFSQVFNGKKKFQHSNVYIFTTIQRTI